MCWVTVTKAVQGRSKSSRPEGPPDQRPRGEVPGSDGASALLSQSTSYGTVIRREISVV